MWPQEQNDAHTAQVTHKSTTAWNLMQYVCELSRTSGELRRKWCSLEVTKDGAGGGHGVLFRVTKMY